MSNITLQNQKTIGINRAPEIAFNLYLCSNMEAWTLACLLPCVCTINILSLALTES